LQLVLLCCGRFSRCGSLSIPAKHKGDPDYVHRQDGSDLCDPGLLITNFTRQIKKLGLLGEAEEIPQEELKAKLLAVRSAVGNMKLRTKFARLGLELRKENAFAPEVIQVKMAEKIDESIIAEIAKQEKRIAAI